MLRSLFILAVYIAFMGAGFAAPFVFTLGYLWADIFRPGSIVYAFLQGIPYALIIGSAAIGAYMVFDRRAQPKLGAIGIFTLLLAAWVTLTTFWAVAPESAWIKWDWAVKSLLFSVFVPYVIRSRNQIEAFLQVYIFSLAGHLIPIGAKTIISGGGYGFMTGLLQSNAFLGQSEILSIAAAGAIPLILVLMKHSRLMPLNMVTRMGYVGLIVLALAAAIGTYARTGVIALVVLAASMCFYSKRKVLSLVLVVVAGFAVYSVAPTAWIERMSTVSKAEEELDGSALTRLAVWRWTLDFVRDNPFGGGFNAYLVNEVTVRVNSDSGLSETDSARAFHSTYFEVLGEHGYLGAILFAMLLAATFFSLARSGRRARGVPALAWCHDLSLALRSSLLAALAGAAFTSMAFLPILYYYFALTFCLQEYIRRVEEGGHETAPSASAAARSAQSTGAWRAARTG